MIAQDFDSGGRVNECKDLGSYFGRNAHQLRRGLLRVLVAANSSRELDCGLHVWLKKVVRLRLKSYVKINTRNEVEGLGD